MELSDRMKEYERTGTCHVLSQNLPLIIRLDGRAFHTFTKGLAKPYDIMLTRLMIDCTKALVAETHALIGYTQSDEISLVLSPDSDYFSRKVFKVCSVLASILASHFTRKLPYYLHHKADSIVSFDARCWCVPNLMEAANYLLWRELDATRNSIQSAAQSVFSHKELHNKNSSQLQEMLFQKRINWNDYPPFFKRGTYVRREVFTTKFSAEEIERLPDNHEAKANPDLEIVRHRVAEIDMPILIKVEDKVAILFPNEIIDNETRNK